MMIEERIEIDLADGRLDARLFLPSGDGPFRVVVFYMDAAGLRPAMSEMAGRLVAAGYAVIQPNLYWRSGPYPPFDPRTMFSDPAQRQRVIGLMDAVDPEDVITDTRALLDSLNDPRLEIQRVGLLGYCMGGRQAFFVAGALGDRLAAMASIHGGGLVKEGRRSPHLGAANIRAPLYFAVADNDGSCTEEDCAVLGATLTDARVDHRIEMYEGARHGFAVPDFPVYDAAAAERHWERVLDLFGSSMVSSG